MGEPVTDAQSLFERAVNEWMSEMQTRGHSDRSDALGVLAYAIEKAYPDEIAEYRRRVQSESAVK